MKRKYGFTLVELLIVLAVIAALIATITPLALNAIRRARATQVAQNLRTLGSAFENATLVDNEPPENFNDLGRDIPIGSYAVTYTATDGEYTVRVLTNADASFDAVVDILSTVESGNPGYLTTTLGTLTEDPTMYYEYMFRLY